MLKRIPGSGWLTSDPLQILANNRLIRSRPVLRAAQAMVRRRGTYRPYERVSLDFALELAERLFADSSRPAVWVNLFFPSELIWGLGLVPFYPEMGAGIGAGLGLSSAQARALALEAAALREADPAPLRGSTMLGQLGILTSIFGHPSDVAYYQALRDYTQRRAQRAEPEQANQKVRLYWMHLRPYSLTDFLYHLEDDLGVVLAFEEASTVWWDALDKEEPVRSLARKLLSNPMNGPVERRVDITLQHIARYRCQGAIHFSHWGCRQSSGALHIVRTRLRKEGVPLLVLDGDCVDPVNLQMGPLRTRAEAFIEMLV